MKNKEFIRHNSDIFLIELNGDISQYCCLKNLYGFPSKYSASCILLETPKLFLNRLRIGANSFSPSAVSITLSDTATRRMSCSGKNPSVSPANLDGSYGPGGKGLLTNTAAARPCSSCWITSTKPGRSIVTPEIPSSRKWTRLVKPFFRHFGQQLFSGCRCCNSHPPDYRHGKAAHRGKRSCHGIFVIRLSHKSSFPTAEQCISCIPNTLYAALCPCQPGMESLSFLMFCLHQRRKTLPKVSGLLFGNRLYNKRLLCRSDKSFVQVVIGFASRHPGCRFLHRLSSFLPYRNESSPSCRRA